MSKTGDLDEVLSRPLAEVPDRGFSDSIALRLIEIRARRARRTTAAAAGALALACLAMPFTGIGQAINGWMLDMVQQASTPLAIVAGALVATALIVQIFSDATEPDSKTRSSH